MSVTSQEKWDGYWMSEVFHVASKSKDRSSKIGAVIVGPDNEPITHGYNGFPRKVNDDVPARHERPMKYFFTEHSERNCIYEAARSGKRLKDSKIYIVATPCADCARGIIQAGIAEVIVFEPTDKLFQTSGRWTESQEAGRVMMAEAGVDFRFFSGSIQTTISCFILGKDNDPNGL